MICNLSKLFLKLFIYLDDYFVFKGSGIEHSVSGLHYRLPESPEKMLDFQKVFWGETWE